MPPTPSMIPTQACQPLDPAALPVTLRGATATGLLLAIVRAIQAITEEAHVLHASGTTTDGAWDTPTSQLKARHDELHAIADTLEGCATTLRCAMPEPLRSLQPPTPGATADTETIPPQNYRHADRECATPGCSHPAEIYHRHCPAHQAKG